MPTEVTVFLQKNTAIFFLSFFASKCTSKLAAAPTISDLLPAEGLEVGGEPKIAQVASMESTTKLRGFVIDDRLSTVILLN